VGVCSRRVSLECCACVLFLQPLPLVAKLAKVVGIEVRFVVEVVPRATIFAALKLT
jgi:hypothetical protein